MLYKLILLWCPSYLIWNSADVPCTDKTNRLTQPSKMLISKLLRISLHVEVLFFALMGTINFMCQSYKRTVFNIYSHVREVSIDYIIINILITKYSMFWSFLNALQSSALDSQLFSFLDNKIPKQRQQLSINTNSNYKQSCCN